MYFAATGCREGTAWGELRLQLSDSQLKSGEWSDPDVDVELSGVNMKESEPDAIESDD